MPIVRIQLLEGRTVEQKEEIAEEIVDLLHDRGNASYESIRVIFEEMAKEDYYTADDFDKE